MTALRTPRSCIMPLWLPWRNWRTFSRRRDSAPINKRLTFLEWQRELSAAGAIQPRTPARRTEFPWTPPGASWVFPKTTGRLFLWHAVVESPSKKRAAKSHFRPGQLGKPAAGALWDVTWTKPVSEHSYRVGCEGKYNIGRSRYS